LDKQNNSTCLLELKSILRTISTVHFHVESIGTWEVSNLLRRFSNCSAVLRKFPNVDFVYQNNPILGSIEFSKGILKVGFTHDINVILNNLGKATHPK
jgi:hypothetical protein